MHRHTIHQFGMSTPMKYSSSKPRLTQSVLTLSLAVTALGAQAQTLNMDTSASNSGAFVFSDSLVGGYAIISATVGAVAPAATIEGTDVDGSITGTAGATYISGAAAPLTGVTLDSANDIVSISSQGGNFQSAPKSGAANGGLLIVNNLSYDSATNQIFADISGSNLAGTYVLPTTREAVFTVGNLAYSTDGGTTYTTIADPTTFALPSAGGTFMIKASSLFTVGGPSGDVAKQFINSLGLKTIGLSTFQGIDTPNSPVWGNDGLGTLTTTITFTPVPEPSTYAILGLGLAGLAAAASRGRKD